MQWLAPLTAVWVAIIYAFPVIPASGVQTTFHQLATHALIALGLWFGLERTELAPAQRRTVWLAVMVPYTLWFAVAWSAAINGVFRTGASAFPALPIAIFLPVVIGATGVAFVEAGGTGARCDADELARCACSFIASLAAGRSRPGCVGRSPVYGHCRPEPAIC